MSSDLDIRELAARVRTKRGDRGLRAVAQEIGGISASTLSRVEQGNIPDLDTFIRLCRWLGVPTDEFLVSVPSDTGHRESTPDIIEAHLRADRTLAPDTVDALATMIRLAFEAGKRGEFDDQRQG